ncbi:MAG: ATP synthase F1 subunit gamma [Deltaproteobacteria bacterium RIFCSPLOWO2_12_FULL_40_28]|nr:MAG: ATP synthase F1 subunit gamma [Deltaproteobacteria bacterium RIFCSPHIGHO2_02_FULL_40_28]OGQ21191.1 MAG: ATP synthase F1 subunit gamma [Deltaproteobacteria bacterium RIFCSPHIGHO2_12_FULL_40_32]OGQ39092.1 MAG: ATP synthase F1 subunit gamma [Deltaproteobacteria bacterium RIFCSPLOWO2_02_FULL_40_36]OGQ53165.1 MAG: ATP synthase F1 subunit gamma [Deltaproteobacteria bacterium RIFCSPLOWO2_12_FULL_40_28]
MASLKEIRKRITSVKNTQKITKAMKMVAAAKLRRAQTAVQQARPYARALKNVISDLVSRNTNHPLLTPKVELKKALFLLYTSNRGLCGGYNSVLLRKVERYVAEASKNLDTIDLDVIGRKGRDFYRARQKIIHAELPELADKFPFARADELASQMIQGFLDGSYDEYYIVYNEFKSAISQEVKIEKILPIGFEFVTQEVKGVDYLYEPSQSEVLDYVIPKFVAMQIYRAHLEAHASELGSRMSAMDSATKNARDMISRLTLVYNRARQASITKDLMDIVNGSEAMK